LRGAEVGSNWKMIGTRF